MSRCYVSKMLFFDDAGTTKETPVFSKSLTVFKCPTLLHGRVSMYLRGKHEIWSIL